MNEFLPLWIDASQPAANVLFSANYDRRKQQFLRFERIEPEEEYILKKKSSLEKSYMDLKKNVNGLFGKNSWR